MKVYVILLEYKNDDNDWYIHHISSIHFCKEEAINIVHKLNDELIKDGYDDNFNYYMEIKEVR